MRGGGTWAARFARPARPPRATLAGMPFLIATTTLEALLREDAPQGDMTTLGLGLGDRPGRALLRAGGPMTLCGVEEAERLFLLAGCGAVRRFGSSGCQLEEGADILQAEGRCAALLPAAATAQRLLAAGAGMATAARRILLAARQGRADIAVACAAVPPPGARDLLLKAVMVAGCTPHRFGLSDSIQVGAAHRAFLGRLPPREWLARLRAAQPDRRIVVEAGSVDEAVLAANSGADAVLLEGMAPEQVAEAVRAVAALDRRVRIAVGGVEAGDAAAYARAGADLLVTAVPAAAPPIPVRLLAAEGNVSPGRTSLGRPPLAAPGPRLRLARCPRMSGIPPGEFDRPDQRQDDRQDAGRAGHARDAGQGPLGDHHHQEGERPGPGDDGVDPEEFRAGPELGRHLFARVLQREGAADGHGAEDDRQQPGIDPQPDADDRPGRMHHHRVEP